MSRLPQMPKSVTHVLGKSVLGPVGHMVLSGDIGSDAEAGVLERGIVCAGRRYEFQRK